MKKSQLRQLIREEIENIAPLKEEYEGQYVIVDKEDPFNEDSIIFEGDVEQIKDYLFSSLAEDNLPEGIELMEKNEWERIRDENGDEDEDWDSKINWEKNKNKIFKKK